MSTLSMFPTLGMSAEQSGFAFPASITETYRPRKIADFIGLEKPKRVLAGLIAKRRLENFIFVGPSGVGKTTMAAALAAEIGAEVHHVPSQNCTLDEVERICNSCHYVPMCGKLMHMILVDEADRMSDAAQVSLLSRLDGTRPIPLTMFVFTCNETDRLEARFLSRMHRLDFSKEGMAPEIAKHLEHIWECEAMSSESPAPNFARLVKEAKNNVRDAMMMLDSELLAS